MKKMVMTIHWRRVFTAAAAAVRTVWGRGAHPMSDAIDDVDAKGSGRP